MDTQGKALRAAGFVLGSIILAGCGGGGGGGGMMTPNNPQPTGSDSFAVTSASRLLSFSRSSPGTTSAMAITGLQAGETIVGIDMRPADGQLYALTSANRMYLINTSTGAATVRSQLMPAAGMTFAGLNGSSFGANFNPVVDQLRVVSNSGQNLRINVDTGLVSVDANLSTLGQPANSSARTGTTAVAYTQSFSNACRTIVSLIDTSQDLLLTSSNLTQGVLTTVGPLGFDASAISAYDIVTGTDGSNTAVAILQVGGSTQVFTLNITAGGTMGAGVALGGLNSGESVTALAINVPTTSPTQAVGNMIGLSASNRIVSFNSASPSRLCTSTTTTGLQPNERLLDIDTRPSDGQLYALGNSGRVYTINPTTGAATVRSTINGTLNGVEFGFQFNPIADQARVVSDTGQNIRINVDTGVTATDTSLTPAGFTVPALAYSNGFAGTTSILAYVLDSQGDQLLSLGAQSGSAGNGDLAIIGSLGVGDIGSVTALEINGVNNQALAAVNVGGAATSLLTQVNLTSGTATTLGTIGGSEVIRGLAVTSVPQTTVVAATTDNRLVTFSPASPGTFTNNSPISGLNNGETLVGLDYRVSNGLLYGLTSTGRVLTVNSSTGALTPVSNFAADPTDNSNPYAALTGAAYGFDFNPVVDVIRTFSDAEENYRAPADTGRVVSDGTLNRAPFSVTAVAYTNSFTPPSTTTLYDIDTMNDVLLIQNPQNAGSLTPVGPLGVDAGAVNGFEIVGPAAGPNTVAFAALSVANGPSALYNINVSTGRATLVGPITLQNATDRVTGLSAPPSATAPAANSTVFAIVNGTSLTSFPRNAPAAATTPRPITGLNAGDSILGADYRPANGLLYALTRQGVVYTIDTNAAAATLIATLPANTLSGTNFGIDFSPLADAIRVISDTGQNIAVNVSTAPGTVTVATSLNFAQPDIVALGYTNNYTLPTGIPSPGTTAIVLDSSTSSTYIVNPTGLGTILPLGRLDPNTLFTKTAALDIVGGTNGLVLAAIQPTDGTTPQTQSVLYTMSPLNGIGSVLGTIGPNGTQAVSAMAVQLR